MFAFHPVSPTRDYSYPWTNEWYNHPTLGGANNDCLSSFTPGVSTDISAAVTNLFAMHNRMHDWSYHLGFTEENWNAQNHNFGNGGAELDALEGDAQAGAATGGYPAFTGRNNANMVPTPDGVPPITNMYLWQPWKGAIYDPCVDGDYDMTVIGHEYTHLIENRMIGKGGGRSGFHAGNMGESFSDLNGIEILHEYSFLPVSDENPFAVGAYVTGQKQRGIRNYGMNFPRTGAFPTPGVSPLTNPFAFGDLGYDASSTSPHADGEVWSAVNHDIRQALVSKYNASFPASNPLLQRQCAEGKRTPDTCPGNRRWIQIMYDAFLLMPVSPTMLQARDAYLAADLMRSSPSVSVNWPSNQNELWLAFARRGFGQRAFSTTGTPLSTSDTDPRPDFESQNHGETTVTFNAVAMNEGNAAVKARVYVGHYEARVSPIADTDPATNAPATMPASTNNLDNVARFVAGTYEFVAHAKGYGHVRFTRTFSGSGSTTVTINMPTNYASLTKGGAATPGPGTQARPNDLIDDTESTNWEATGAPVSGRYITVDLAGTSARTVNRVQVSALNIQGQNRFTMLRKFRIETSTDGVNFTPVSGGSLSGGTSVDNAFPGDVIRPLVPDMILRSFSFSPRSARYVRLVVLTNQCTGQTRFQGVQDSDPLNATDCRTAMEPIPDPPGSFSPQDRSVRAAELQVFSSAGGAGNGNGNGQPPPPPPPNGDDCDIDDDIVKLGPAVAKRGSNVEYTITYTNHGDTDDDDCEIDDLLGDDLTYVSSTGGGTYDAATGTVTWRTGKVAAGATRSFTLTAKVAENATIGDVLINRAYFGALGLDLSPLGTATTLVVTP